MAETAPDPAADARLVAEELGEGHAFDAVHAGMNWHVERRHFRTLCAWLPPEHATALVALARRSRQRRAELERMRARVAELEQSARDELERLRAEAGRLHAELFAAQDGSARRALAAEVERLRAQLAECRRLRAETGDGPAVSEAEAVRRLR